MSAATAVSVAELQAAWAATTAGHFRTAAAAHPSGGGGGWGVLPWGGAQVVTVAGAHGNAGASTLAVAVAEHLAATGADVALVDAADPARSGLVCAASAELGPDRANPRWRVGRRGPLTIYRAAAGELTPPGPPALAADVVVVDAAHRAIADLAIAHDGAVGWPGRAGSGWAGSAATVGDLVLVARATVAGVRHTETALAALEGRVPPPVVAVLGPRRWPRPVRAALGPLTRAADHDGRLVALVEDGRFAPLGVTVGPLPPRVSAAGSAVATHLSVTVKEPTP